MLKKLKPYIDTITSKEKIFAAYLLVHTNTRKVYVGSTNQPGLRFKTHFNKLKKQKHINYKLQKAYDEDPTFHTIVYKVATRAKAFDLEQALINYYLPKDLLLNISLSARFSFRGLIITAEGRTRLSLARKGKRLKRSTRMKMSRAKRKKRYPERKGLPVHVNTAKKNRSRNKARSKSITIDAVVYSSVKAAARSLKLAKNTVKARLKSDKWSTWLWKTA